MLYCGAVCAIIAAIAHTAPKEETMSLINVNNDAIQAAFKKEKVLTLDQLTDLLNCSRRTVQRRLKEWGTYASYNKNGRYYVLSRIPKFDANNLWKHKGIFFSKTGNLKETIHALVNQSLAGLSVSETSRLVEVPLSSFFAQSRYFEQLRREKISARFVYFSKEESTFIKQKLQREAIENREKLESLPSDMLVIMILVEKIKHPDSSIEELSKNLCRKGHQVTKESICNLFEHHGLIKKTVDIEESKS